ncbi:MAG: hypothetical protein KBD78_09035 [Oligoflexales bacterium]|nr:hypothetical protein [Oligoflexales bacterium]
MKEFLFSTIISKVMTRDEFMRDYWNKKPLFIKGAVPKDKVGLMMTKSTYETALANEVQWSWAASWDQAGEVLSARQGDDKKGRVYFLPKISAKNAAVCREMGAYLNVDNFTSHNEAAAILAYSIVSETRVSGFDYLATIAQGDNIGKAKKGYNKHTDPQDVYTLQLVGSKRWRVGTSQFMHAGPITVIDSVGYLKNRTGEILPWEEWSRGVEYEVFDLEEGDFLYIPPYTIHETEGLGDYNIGFNFVRLVNSILYEVDAFLLGLDPDRFYEIANSSPTPSTTQELKDSIVGKFKKITDWLEKIDAKDFSNLLGVISANGRQFMKKKPILHQTKLEKETKFSPNLLNSVIEIKNVTSNSKNSIILCINGSVIEFDDVKWHPLAKLIKDKVAFSAKEYLFKNKLTSPEDWEELKTFLDFLLNEGIFIIDETQKHTSRKAS